MKTRLILALLATSLTAACAGNSVIKFFSPPPTPLERAVDNPTRSTEFRARDVYRHPLQTLKFFDVNADMTVVEIWPGAGWYTEILAPLLRGRGQYIAAGFVVSAENSPRWRQDMAQDFAKKFANSPELYGHVQVTELGAPDRWQMAPAGSADRVLTFRNVHNWMTGGFEREMFAAMFTALKPGGVLGVVEHRAKPDATLEQMKKSGYVTEAYVIQLAENAGFKLQAKSEINANLKDSKDYPQGVWTLPPTLRLGEQDKQKYLDIGESDRMTLKFVKPK
ncbi:class I SAM-dependent methyltransferase [Stenotrophobium rhamnosiphilum]|uniref:Methyltransferase n=1 Tax=Stenotrophobium rhamnosiphilum TaxID=2029166 RepID=A0A2T5MFJ5_9GAMM|nr:class I SAM-dependent methyltransferase [Stenotrophobium rhamnosiphilum]PTU31337.1 methyltransferase [Stenotrophobium rhamnosiphilum]